MTMHQVFVYGTLRQGEVNHQRIEAADCISQTASIKGAIYTTKRYFPALIDGNQTVYGELFKVNDEQLKAIDELEGYVGDGKDNFYDRRLVTVKTDQGEVEALTYFLNEAHHDMLGEAVQHQDWKVHQLIESDEDFLYFAFGSCMDDERFRQAGVDHFFKNLTGRGELDDFSLRFAMKAPHGNHAADIIEDGGYVEGKVYQLPHEGLDYLFKREGVYVGYYRPAVVRLRIDGKAVDNVLTFLVLNKYDEEAPTELYATEILRGGKGTLSDDYWHNLREKIRTQFNMTIDV